MVEDDLLMKLDFEMRELGARPNLREFARVSGRQKWKLQRGLGRFRGSRITSLKSGVFVILFS